MAGMRLKQRVKSAFRWAGYALVPMDTLGTIQRQSEIGSKASLIGMIRDENLRRAVELLGKSHSQLNQDLFVLQELGWKRDGYFVEFGATDGQSLNNSWLLEKEFGWTGILAEPARVWREALLNSGRTAIIELDCVLGQTGHTVEFTETEYAELSTVTQFDKIDARVRKAAGTYLVDTVSLNDMLERHGAPAEIDYLSIDTEGSELEILSNLDFDRYRFGCITCEHNFARNRQPLHDLLTGHGYRRKFTEFSAFDDWYVYAP